jgi:hypothetical protein
MAHHNSGHLWSALILAAAATLALAAERFAADPRGATTRVATPDAGDIGGFVVAGGADVATPVFVDHLHADPLEPRSPVRTATIASQQGAPTVSSSPSAGRRLTAILVADNRPVAVVDNQVVQVGDQLKDGARVSAIRDDRVWLVEKDGKWRVLTLTGRP